jgi:F0F1-type ATP synthase assembly protein I
MEHTDTRDQHRVQIWTQREMLSAVVAGILIGFAIGLIF